MSRSSGSSWCGVLAVAATWALVLGACQAADETKPDELKIFKDVTFVRRGEKALQSDIYVPPGNGPFPGVLMVHGGAWVAGTKWQMGLHARAVAKHGYTVVAIDYRLAPAAKFPAQVDDCKDAVRWMRRNAAKYKIDAERIAGYGYSAGGHLVSLLGATSAKDGLEGEAADADSPSTRLQAVVAGGAPCSFTELPANSKAMTFLFGGTRAEKPDVYRQASPTTFVTKDDPPFFFFHGEDDRVVPRNSPERMAKLLREAGVSAQFYLVADKGHLLTFLDGTARDKAIAFLDETLKPQPAP